MRKLFNWLCFRAILLWPQNFEKPLSKAWLWMLERAGEHAYRPDAISARLSHCEHLWLCGIAKRQALLKAERQSPEFKRSMQIQIDLLKWCLEDLKTVQSPEAQLPSRIP